MEFSFRGPPSFWRKIAEMAEAAERGETVFTGSTKEVDPYATADWRITFIGDPQGDGVGMLYIPGDDDGEVTTAPWDEISERIATGEILNFPDI